MKTYKVKYSFEVSGIVAVTAETERDAMDYAESIINDSIAHYKQNTYVTSTDVIGCIEQIHNGNEWQEFKVSVAGYNAELFRENYRKFIVNIENDYCDNILFTLRAPQTIKDEIGMLTDECIDII